MASNLACIGLAVDDDAALDALVGNLTPPPRRLVSVYGVDLYRWQDASGARLVLGIQDGALVDLLPSFAGRPGVRLAECRSLNAEVATAAVVDADGEQTTAMAFELEQRGALDAAAPWSGEASVVALATDVTVFADEDEFAASPRSLLSPERADDPPPESAVERGLKWPPRMGAESFISYGVFGDPAAAEAYARLNGAVLAAERRTNALTGQAFTVCRVRCLGFEVDVLLDASFERLPAAGEIVGGTVFLVARIDALNAGGGPTVRRRRFGFGRRG